MSTDAWGVLDSFEDALGKRRKIPLRTREQIVAAMDGDPRSAPPQSSSVRVIRQGQTLALPDSGEIVLEDGTAVQFDGVLPPDLPAGYHALHYDGHSGRLIVSPGVCHLPPSLHTWGWSAQLYAARSEDSWGIGDLADLRRLSQWAAHQGAGLLLINPLDATTPVIPQESSPYSPSTRRFRNPLYLRVEEIRGARACIHEIDRLAAAGRALNQTREIDRDAVFRLKMEALEFIWKRFDGDRGFDRYRLEQGQPLRDFAVFSALAEQHGGDWRQWPSRYREPKNPEVVEFTEERSDRIRFHEWLQWLLDLQLAYAIRELSLMQDLPIGFNPGGFDAWIWQDVLATGTSVGAPPDEYSAEGQNWGLPPFIPHKLRQAGYEPFVQTIRAALRHSGGLRIDHVMGLFRLWWVPEGKTPKEGGYVRYSAEELLAIVALESQRAGAVIVGEDLGTVEPMVRDQLARHRMLSYRVAWFEDDLPSSYPVQALAAVSTHDLPTIVGLWTGADLKEQRTLGLKPDEGRQDKVVKRLRQLAGVASEAPVAEVIERTYARLGEAPSMIVLGSLDDACAVTERPNMPGTAYERPNWSLALPQPIEYLRTAPLARAIAGALGQGRRGGSLRPAVERARAS